MRKIARSFCLVFSVALVSCCLMAASPAQKAHAATKPAQVKSVAVKAVSSSSLKVTWKKVSGAKGYKVAYSTKSTMKGAKTITVKGGTIVSKTIKSLKKYSTYYVKVRAYKSSKNLGKWSVKRSTRTLCSHSGGKPTCEKLAVCVTCKKTYGKVAPHALKAATCTEASTCISCKRTFGKPLGHTAGKDGEATCTKAAVCYKCGATFGESLGHNYVEKCNSYDTCTRCGGTTGHYTSHEYDNPTCTKPYTCLRCGETYGDPLGHSGGWASCTERAICSRCNLYYGEKAPHELSSATCVEPAKCINCGYTDGLLGSHYTRYDSETCYYCEKNVLDELYSWEDLSRMSKEIADCATDEEGYRLAHEYDLTPWSDGSVSTKRFKRVVVDSVEYRVAIIGIRHDKTPDGKAVGLTFGFADVIDSRVMNTASTNAGGWAQSEMHSWLNGAFLAKLPGDLKGRIVPVAKWANSVGVTDSEECVGSTNDAVWLPSAVEVLGESYLRNYSSGTTLNIYLKEGSQYSYFSGSNTKKSKAGSTLAVGWWTRSSDRLKRSSGDCFVIVSSGGGDGYCNAGSESGVSPCFCL